MDPRHGATAVAAAAAAAAHDHGQEQLMGVDPTSFGGKRVEDGDEEEYDDDDDGDKEKNRNGKRSRRHNWQQKYEMEFGLIPIERDALTNDVTLAMCGFCKAFGRESKFEQLMQQDNETGENKKKRRRSLTTTKFFRAFRVDNIRSHLLGAHPRRWAEFEILPKQETIRSRFLQLQTGEYNYDGISMVDDVGLVHGDGDITGYQSQALTEGHVVPSPVGYIGKTKDVQEPFGLRKRNNRLVAAGSRHGNFDYEKHLIEQLALDRERLDFEKARFKKEVELRERELATIEKKIEHERTQFEKEREANLEKARLENAKVLRITEILREAVSGHSEAATTDAMDASVI